MIEKQTKLPDQSILKKDEKSFHYIDSFQSQYNSAWNDHDIISVGILFLTGGPRWVDGLMSVRDKVAGLFRLKTADQLTSEQKNPNSFKFEVGEQLDIFKLYAKTNNELILGDDDKHLSFRVSLLLDYLNDGSDKRRLIISTVVEYKNLFGRLYFIPVKPIHQLIVKGTLKEIVRQIEKEATQNR